jgi:N-acetylglucosamine-6-phosphate deacetylase
MSVEVLDGVARVVPEDGTPESGGEGPIAGGTAHLIDVVRLAVAGGVPLTDAVRSATAVPARVLGLAGEVGSLEPGVRADILITDTELRPVRVLRRGVDVAAG